MNNGQTKLTNVVISWPDLEFPPINLNVLVDAWWFYASDAERKEYLEKCLISVKRINKSVIEGI